MNEIKTRAAVEMRNVKGGSEVDTTLEVDDWFPLLLLLTQDVVKRL
jgi:hypothetical protein